MIDTPRTDANSERILAGLNPEQRDVVLHDKGPLLAVAVAGAGKTAAVVRRIAYLVDVRGVDPGRILAVTFSKKGADEMNARLEKLLGKTDARVGTFHSLALEMLREETEQGTWTVDDRNRYAICLKDAAGYKELNIAKEVDLTQLASCIGKCKASLARPGSDEAAEIFRSMLDTPRDLRLGLEVYGRAEELRRERQLLTFDDMLLDAAELLRDDAEVRGRWSKRWDYVIQDEAQDQNLAQLVIGEQLALGHRNYMLVGDPAQTIFTFRGAQPRKLLDFEKTWSARVITMGRNYRCGSTIITAANAALDTMDPAQRLPVVMISERGVVGEITSTSYSNPGDEGDAIAEKVQALVAGGMKYSDIVVLYRTHACSRAVEEAMLTARIPYQILGGANFYDRREVRALIAYLRLAAGRGDGEDVERSINTPFRFLGRAFVERVVGAARAAHGRGEALDWVSLVGKVAAQEGLQQRQRTSARQWADLIHGLADRVHAVTRDVECPDCKGTGKDGSGNPHDDCGGKGTARIVEVPAIQPQRALRDLTMDTDYIAFLKKDEGDESVENDRASNVNTLIDVVATHFTTIDALLDYIAETQAKAAAARRAEKEAPKENKVTLTTLHRSKGLEWPVVFLAGVSAGMLPHAFAEDIEEERRLFYVGITRARDELHISSTMIGVNGMEAGPSEFLGGIGLSSRPRRSEVTLDGGGD